MSFSDSFLLLSILLKNKVPLNTLVYLLLTLVYLIQTTTYTFERPAYRGNLLLENSRLRKKVGLGPTSLILG